MANQSFYKINHQFRYRGLLTLHMAQIRLQKIFDNQLKLVNHAKEITENVILDFVEPMLKRLENFDELYIVDQKIRLHKDNNKIDLVIKITDQYLLHVTAENEQITSAEIFTYNYPFEAPLKAKPAHHHVEIVLANQDIVHCIMFNDKFLNKCFQLNNKIYIIEELIFNPLLVKDLENYLGQSIHEIRYQSSHVRG